MVQCHMVQCHRQYNVLFKIPWLQCNCWLFPGKIKFPWQSKLLNSCYSMPIHWLVHGHMTSNNVQLFLAKWCERVTLQKLWRRTVQCYLQNVDHCCMWLEVAWCCRWNLSVFFKLCFCFGLLYNKSLNDCSPWDQSLVLNVKYIVAASSLP